MGIFFDTRPKAANVQLMPRQEHLKKLATLLQTDLTPDNQSLALGHVSRLYELVRSSTVMSDYDRVMQTRALNSIQELVEKNEPGTRNTTIQFVRVLLAKEQMRKQAA